MTGFDSKGRKLKPVKALSKNTKKEVRKIVKKIVRDDSELKYMVPYEAGKLLTSTASIVGLTDNAVGTTDSTHIGDRLRLSNKRMEFKVRFGMDAGNDATQALPMCRIILFQWRPATTSGGATEPTAANLLLTGPSGSPDVLSYYNHDLRQEYHIIDDITYNPVGPGTATSNAYNPSMQKFIRKTYSMAKIRKDLQYSAGSTVLATNHIYALFLSDLASDAQNPFCTWSAKIYYTDA